MHPIHAVLFDLDGTLIDTAPDLAYSLNQLREEENLPPLALSDIRSMVGDGSKIIIKKMFGIEEHDPHFHHLRSRFLELYQIHLADESRLFPGIEDVLDLLDKRHIPWGIVTNKLTHHTIEVLKALHLDHRPACVICGDTLAQHKPDPEPILYACKLLKKDPKNCMYVGDSMTDIIASKAAGTRSLVVLYGYTAVDDDPFGWHADAYVREPMEIISWL